MFSRRRSKNDDDHERKQLKKINQRLDKVEGKVKSLDLQLQVLRRES